MSETAEALRSALWELAQATGRRAKEAWYGNAMAAFDTLIAEHRAEIEDAHAQATAAIESATKAIRDRDTARDAALEEAKQAVTAAFEADDDVAAQDVIDALKSQPARQYVDAEKVRDVLKWAAGLLTRQGYGFGIIRDIATRLGVDLDAKGEPDEMSPLVCDCGHGIEVHGEEDWAPGCRERGCECRTYRRSVVSP